MIDQYSDDRTGWARFSDDMTMRFRLARSLSPDRPLVLSQAGVLHFGAPFAGTHRIVFLLLNPSDADAFDPDPTVTECRKRAKAFGAGILEVVNLFAWRSPYPTDLKKRAYGFRGDTTENNEEILNACTGAHLVIAGWGNDGRLDNRDIAVRRILKGKGIDLHHLGKTNDGHPKHPLARGKHRIPADQQPIPWTP